MVSRLYYPLLFRHKILRYVDVFPALLLSVHPQSYNYDYYVALVLHAHLPFVRHPESDYVLEEEWLYEAITETYIPYCEFLRA